MNNKFWEDFQKTYTKLMLRQTLVLPDGVVKKYEALCEAENEKIRALGRKIIEKCEP